MENKTAKELAYLSMNSCEKENKEIIEKLIESAKFGDNSIIEKLKGGTIIYLKRLGYDVDIYAESNNGIFYKISFANA